MDRKDLRLYLVTDRAAAGNRDLMEIVLQAVEGGVTMVQLREKDAPTREFLELAFKLKEVLSEKNIPLIINDRIDIALACDADGVHIGQGDMPYHIARRILGKDKIIGLSVENFEQIEKANALDVDYIGVSPVFATPTKTDTAQPFGLEGLDKAVKMSVHPVVGIGGMNTHSARQVIERGADGIAVVSAIIASKDPRSAAKQLLDLIK